MRRRLWKGNWMILLLVAIFFGLSAPEGTCSAQEILSWEPFHAQCRLSPTVPAPGTHLKKSLFFSADNPDSRPAPLIPGKENEDQREEENTWAIHNWGFFSLSLSTLNNRIPERDIRISGTAEEKSRMEMIRSLTSGFSDMSSRKRFQSFGEIFEPELKLGIEF